jgi:hypothetical protein
VALGLRFTLSFNSVKKHCRLVGDIGDGLAKRSARVVAIGEDPTVQSRILEFRRHRIAKPKVPIVSGPSAKVVPP